jgi:hypothetical protein
VVDDSELNSSNVWLANCTSQKGSRSVVTSEIVLEHRLAYFLGSISNLTAYSNDLAKRLLRGPLHLRSWFDLHLSTHFEIQQNYLKGL